MKQLILISVMLFALGCSQNDNAVGNSGRGNVIVTEPSMCALELKLNSTNREVAIAFNNWRVKCNPSDVEFNVAVEKL